MLSSLFRFQFFKNLFTNYRKCGHPRNFSYWVALVRRYTQILPTKYGELCTEIWICIRISDLTGLVSANDYQFTASRLSNAEMEKLTFDLMASLINNSTEQHRTETQDLTYDHKNSVCHIKSKWNRSGEVCVYKKYRWSYSWKGFQQKWNNKHWLEEATDNSTVDNGACGTIHFNKLSKYFPS